MDIAKSADWINLQEKRVARLRVWIDYDFCVHAADLPGCASQGENIEDCLANIEEAFQGIVASYDENKEPIPWSNVWGIVPLFHEERFIAVELECLNP